jgi:hypothetical protein
MDKRLNVVETHRTGMVVLQGTFKLNSSAAVLTTGDSPDVSWVKTTTGVYTGTLAAGCKMNGLGMAFGWISDSSSASAQFIETASCDLSGGTVVLRTCAEATGAIADTGVAITVNYIIWGKNSGVA